MNAFTKVHDGIAPNIFTNAGICAMSPSEEPEILEPDDSRFQWWKALWDTSIGLLSVVFKIYPFNLGFRVYLAEKETKNTLNRLESGVLQFLQQKKKQGVQHLAEK